MLFDHHHAGPALSSYIGAHSMAADGDTCKIRHVVLFIGTRLWILDAH
jgi:hypothetical protein